MQTCRAFLLLLCLFAPVGAFAKVHSVTLGAARRVPYTPPEATADSKSEDATSLKIRPLLVDGLQKEWTVGDLHEVTDRTFVIRRALHLNDALAGEAARWSWQPGPWLSVDRTTGHVTALHLPDFDPEVSSTLVWFRDYAAYCGVHVLAKSSALTAMVWEMGGKRPAVSQKIAGWPMTPASHAPCAAASWQRTPMRATIRPVGLAAMTFDITGTTSLVEEGDGGEEP